MTTLQNSAITSRTATILVDADTQKYTLDTPIQWCLNDGLQVGKTETVPVFIDRLEPSTKYSFHVGEHRLDFTTAPCAGLVVAGAFGVSPSNADNSEAFATAIAAVPAGGTLMVPAGRYVTGPIFLKSDMTLLLDEGAEIYAHGDRSEWPILPEYDDTNRLIGTWEGLPEPSFASPITAIGARNLVITGRGILDGGGDRGDWWSWPKETRQGARRPRTLFMADCHDVILSGITVCNSPSWTIHPLQCHNLTVAGIKVINPADSPNTDGFDPESCTHVHVQGVYISVGDDCIAVKSGKIGTGSDTRRDHIAPTKHLTIENCLMADGHGAVVMGSEMSGDITDVVIRHCEFKGTDRGLRIKTRRGRGGRVARISMSDVSMTGVGTALAANAFYFCDADGKSDQVQSRIPAKVDETTPLIQDIIVDNVTLSDVRHAAAAFLGLPEAPLKGIKLSNLNITYDETASCGDTLMACNLPQVRHGGILHRFTDIDVDTPLRPLLKELNDVV